MLKILYKMKLFVLKSAISVIFAFIFQCVLAQKTSISGKVFSEGKEIEFANVYLINTSHASLSDSAGKFFIQNITPGDYQIQVSCLGYLKTQKSIAVKANNTLTINFTLEVDKTALNEVVITGVSKATRVRENPVSIVTISTKVIDRTNESNIIDVLVKNVPGLSAVKTGPNISKPFIRGLGYNRVLTLFDGIRQEGQQWGDEHGIEVDAYNIEKAEVIKGPSSLMFGSDALAGVVSLFPNIPNENDRKIEGKITSEYQSNNNLIGNGFRINYNNKSIQAAFSGSYRIAKNYSNAIDGRIYNTNFDEKNLSAFVGYTSAKGYSHLNFTAYDNLQGIPDGSRDSLTRKFTKQIYEGNNDDILNRPFVTEQELDSYQLSPLHQRIQHFRIYTHNFYKIGEGDINLSFAFQQNLRKEYNHPTAPEQAGLNLRLNTYNFGLRYNAPAFSNIETSLGTNGMFQNNKNLNGTDFPIPDYNLFDAGVYIYTKWKKEKWTISGGVRYDIRQIEWNDFYVETNPTTGFDEHINTSDTSKAVLQFSKYNKTFGGISASLGFTYALNKEISFKANIARGYRAPNITELASNGLDPGAHIIYLGNKNFNPEFSLQEDIGATANFKNVSASLSLFNNNIQNYIHLSIVVDANNNPVTDVQGNKTYQYQTASAQLYGLEATLSFHPEKLNGFSFDNNFALIYGLNTKSEFKDTGLKGEYLPLIPPMKWLSAISQKVNFKTTFLTSLTPKVEVELNTAQNRFLALNNTETFTPNYTLLNFGISADLLHWKNNSCQLEFQLNNILDQAYQSNLSRLKYFEYYSQSSTKKLGLYNMGRNICLKIIFKL